MERTTNCVKCGEPNVDDCLTADGLCFPCDVEETCDRIEPEHVGAYLDAISTALPYGYRLATDVPSSGSLGVN